MRFRLTAQTVDQNERLKGPSDPGDIPDACFGMWGPYLKIFVPTISCSATSTLRIVHFKKRAEIGVPVCCGWVMTICVSSAFDKTAKFYSGRFQ